MAGRVDESLSNYRTGTCHGFTGFMYAAKYGHLDICKLLAKHELRQSINEDNLMLIG